MPSTKILKEKIETLPFLINKISEKNKGLEIPSHALLIGAGCSVSCNIPLGKTVVDLCKIYSFLNRRIPDAATFLNSGNKRFEVEALLSKIKEQHLEEQYNSYINDLLQVLSDKVRKEEKIHLQHISTMLGENNVSWEDFEAFIFNDNQYGFWMDRYSEDPRERQRFIEELIDNHPPTGAYIFLSFLIEKKIFTNILTTNFDDLINEALTYYTDVRCRFYADDELSQYISIHSSKPNLIKLHGDYRFANIKNTVEETEQLSKNLKLKFEELLSQLGLIIIGYNGADHSIMSVLNEIKRKWKFSLIWCGKDADNVHWRVAQLINNTSNSYFIHIESFDALVGQLVNFYLKDPPKDLIKIAQVKTTEVQHFLEQFKISFRETDVSESEKVRLEQTIDKWDIFNKANESTIDDQKLKLYTQFIELDNTNLVAYRNRGFIYKKFSQYKEALEDYSKAISLTHKPELYAELYAARAEIYLDLKDYDMAKADCDQAINYNSKNMYAYNNRGFVYLFLREYNKAIEDFKMALSFDIAYKNPHCHLGVAYSKINDYNTAFEHVNTAIRLAPTYGRAFFNRGKIWELLNEHDKAGEDLDKAKELLFYSVYKEQENLWAL